LQSEPSHPDANHNLGVLAVSVNKANAALPLFKTALEANPKIEQFWLSYIDALIKEKQFKNAKQALEQCNKVGLFGEKLDTLEKQINAVLSNLESNPSNQNELSPAIEALKNAHENEPNNVSHMIRLGEFFRRAGKVSEALAILEDATKLAPRNANAWANLGVAFQQDKNIDAAKMAYEKALAINPNSAVIWSNLGSFAKDAGDLDSALRYFEKSVEIQPDLAEIRNNLGAMLKLLGRLEDAEASYRKAIALKPGFTEAHYNLGNMLRELGKLEGAEASYRKAIALKPDYADAHSNLGVTLQELGRLEEAEASYIEAITLKPDYAYVHFNLGITLKELGRLEEAIASYRKAIALKPDYADAHNNLGNTLRDFDRLEEAEASYRKAIALKPDYADARHNLGMLLSETKQYEKAAEQFELSNFEESKYYLLRCLYLQDKKSLFFDQLDYFINQGEIHPMIGSLGCRSALRYGIERPNLFCKDPLKYVLKTNLNNQYNFEKIFVKTARTILNENKILDRRQDLLTNGRQTSGNLFDLEPNFTEEIQKIIRSEIEKYQVYFKNSEEGFIASWPTDYSLRGWLVSMESGGKLRPHMHENGWISGSIYINVPPKSKNESGNFVVCIEEEYLTGGNGNQEENIDVVTGDMVLFPASLLHYTIPFESEKERIVLAFDVEPV